jgi:type II secretory pathway pseudopilin PulG
VIAIIAILASLLLPALGAAKARALSIACTANLQQLGTGILMYTDDYEETLPANIGGTAVLIAIENDELREAAVRRPESGRGFPLQARVLPTVYDTVRPRSEPDPALPTDP